MSSSRQAESASAERTWRRGRAVVGLCGLLFSAMYLVEGAELATGSLDEPGPGIYPRVVGIAFALTSLAVIAEALRTRRPGTTSFPAGADRRRLLVVAAGFAGYLVLLPVLGFVVMTAVFTAFFVQVTGRPPLRRTAITAAVLTAAVYLVFTVVLDVTLPEPFWS